MADRFKRTLYMLTRFKLIDGHICTIANADGTLFSGLYANAADYDYKIPAFLR